MPTKLSESQLEHLVKQRLRNKVGKGPLDEIVYKGLTREQYWDKIANDTNFVIQEFQNHYPVTEKEQQEKELRVLAEQIKTFSTYISHKDKKESLVRFVYNRPLMALVCDKEFFFKLVKILRKEYSLTTRVPSDKELKEIRFLVEQEDVGDG